MRPIISGAQRFYNKNLENITQEDLRQYWLCERQGRTKLTSRYINLIHPIESVFTRYVDFFCIKKRIMGQLILSKLKTIGPLANMAAFGKRTHLLFDFFNQSRSIGSHLPRSGLLEPADKVAELKRRGFNGPS